MRNALHPPIAIGLDRLHRETGYCLEQQTCRHESKACAERNEIASFLIAPFLPPYVVLQGPASYRDMCIYFYLLVSIEIHLNRRGIQKDEGY